MCSICSRYLCYTTRQSFKWKIQNDVFSAINNTKDNTYNIYVCVNECMYVNRENNINTITTINITVKELKEYMSTDNNKRKGTLKYLQL